MKNDTKKFDKRVQKISSFIRAFLQENNCNKSTVPVDLRAKLISHLKEKYNVQYFAFDGRECELQTIDDFVAEVVKSQRYQSILNTLQMLHEKSFKQKIAVSDELSKRDLSVLHYYTSTRLGVYGKEKKRELRETTKTISQIADFVVCI